MSSNDNKKQHSRHLAPAASTARPYPTMSQSSRTPRHCKLLRRRLWSDWVDAQADLIHHLARRSFCCFFLLRLIYKWQGKIYTFLFFLIVFHVLFFDTLLYAFNNLGPFGKISSEQNLQKMVYSIDIYTFCTHQTVYGVFIRLCMAKWNWNDHFPSSKMQSYTRKITKFYGRVNCINVHNALHQLRLRLTYKLRCIYVMCNANTPISSMSGIIRLMFSAHLLINIEPVCVLSIASLVSVSLISTVVELSSAM